MTMLHLHSSNEYHILSSRSRRGSQGRWHSSQYRHLGNRPCSYSSGSTSPSSARHSKWNKSMSRIFLSASWLSLPWSAKLSDGITAMASPDSASYERTTLNPNRSCVCTSFTCSHCTTCGCENRSASHARLVRHPPRERGEVAGASPAPLPR